MKTALVLVTVLITTAIMLPLVTTVEEYGSCGIVPVEPITPIGCRGLRPRCYCDSAGDCEWDWICIR